MSSDNARTNDLMIGPPIVNVAEAMQKHSWQMITWQIRRIIEAMKAYKYNPPSPEPAGGVVYFVLAPQAAGAENSLRLQQASPILNPGSHSMDMKALIWKRFSITL